MQVLSTPSQQIRGNLQLPDALRQNAVLLEFAEPIRRSMAGNFLRIQMTEFMLAGGEDAFYMVSMTQPHREPRAECRYCRRPMHRESVEAWRCVTPNCVLPNGRPTRTVQQISRPARGVVKLMVTDDCIHHTDQTQVIDRFLPSGQPVYRRNAVDWLKAVVLLLDRRYDDIVLAAIKRTAGNICDQMGWALAR